MAALGLGLALVAGCQTYVPEAGMTLPSGRYLEHPPAYYPPSPPFPLPRELANLEAAAARAPGAPGVPPPPGALPPPVPLPPPGGAQPPPVPLPPPGP
jgi:hypothetical protein